MSYFKGTIDNYIGAVGTGKITNHGVIGANIASIGEWSDFTEISESEYNELLSVFKSKPHAEGKGYKLKDDLTWEAYDLPVPSDEDEIPDAEAYSIIMGEI